MNTEPPPLPEFHVPYASIAPRAGRTDPWLKAVGTVAVVAIVLAAIDLLTGARGLLHYLGVTKGTVLVQAYWQNPTLLRWMTFNAVRECVVGGFLLVCGIGGLNHWPRSRILFMIYATYSLLVSVPFQLVYWMYIRPIQELLRIHTLPSHTPINPAVHQVVLIITPAIVVIAAAFDGYVIYLMTRPQVKALFHRE